jgi:dipeptidyl aminopeptidase/acylaminoacyl peptidase
MSLKLVPDCSMKYRTCRWYYRIMACIICMLPCTVWSQHKDTLKTITPSDYNKWYDLENSGFSSKGSWIGYNLYNTESGKLVIRQMHGNTGYVIDSACDLRFLGDSMAVYNKNNKCYIMFPGSGRKEVFPSGTGFRISKNGQVLVIFNELLHKLVLRSLPNNDSLAFTDVSNYVYNPVAEGVCVVSSENSAAKINIVSTVKGFHVKNINVPQNRGVLELRWHLSGNFLAFVMGRALNSHDTTDAGLVGYFDLKNGKNWILNPAEKNNFPRGHVLVSHWKYPLEFSPDGKQVFFAHSPEKTETGTENPEIWKSDDPYARQSLSAWSYNVPKISMWDPVGNKHMLVTDQDEPEAFYGLGKDYALVYNSAQYRFCNDPLTDTLDVYLMDMESGERILLIKKFVNDFGSMNMSPSGRYVMYLQDSQWWCYDTRKDQLYNLTEKLEIVSGMKSTDGFLKYPPEGWTRDEDAVFMYDRYDLWKISIGSASCERITHGREDGVSFRLIDNNLDNQSNLRNNRGIYLDDPIWFFEVRKEDKMGYACKMADDRVEYIVFDECYTRWPEISMNNEILGFTLEYYNIPPVLMAYDAGSDSLLQIFRSNPQCKDYQWYERKRIDYQNKSGKKLTGILYYPMDLQKDSLYPMVVYVYEKQAKNWQQYINPTYYNPTGFNQADLTAEGYFVFLPDIEYETGEPGFSAADCIISGTKAALHSAPINPAKIGLMGQSFGGYETMFTITQTSLFATAIAGAGVSNLPSDYFNIEGTHLRFFQYESSQLRMNKPLFEDYQGYLDNSPLYHAQNIRIPFLLFTGGKDYHVNYTQTMALHFAMKRLGRQNAMLIYANEAHAFSDAANMKDLTIKVHQWFEHYLKGGEKLDWMP